jgi:hypothetical protein
MNPTLKKALYIIFISLGLAFVFNYLFFSKLIGISVIVFVAILLGTIIAFSHYQQVSVKKTWWLIALIAFFALMPGIRANAFLTSLNVVATFGLLMLLAHQLVGTPVFLMKLRDYFLLAILVPLRMLIKGLSTLSELGQIQSNLKHQDAWLRILKGVVMAVPILIIFGALFSQADLAFSAFVVNFIHIGISAHFVQYTVLLLFAFLAGLCYFSYIFLPRSVIPAPEPESSPAQPGKNIEVLVFLALIASLFLLFIGFQITYLFGGQAYIASWGFTYAEYARRGFWELLMVAVLSLLVLLASEKHAGSEGKKDKYFLVPALVLIAEVMVIIVSAFKRLSLYIDAYSLTEQRFYVTAFIILLFVLFILLAIKFLKSKPENFFTFGTLLTGAAFLVAINLINPDGFIASYSLKKYNQTGKVDAYYVGRLSADATVQQLDLYQKLRDEDKITLQNLLQTQKGRLQIQNINWQSANLSRNRALKTLQNY